MPESRDPKDLHGKRDQDSFEALFREHYRPITSFFQRRGFSAEESEDLAQETFLRAFRGLGRVRDRPSVRSWLYAVAANVWRNAVRSRSAAKRSAIAEPLESVVLEDSEDRMPDQEAIPTSRALAASAEALSAVLHREMAELLTRALDELPPRMRQAVLLRVGRDLKYQEIAALQQISVDTIKAQMLQARRKLREMLSEHFDDIDF